MLPPFVDPMLAKIGQAFDSDDHQFELKWDGFRALAFRERCGVRIRSRRDRPMEERYPEVVQALESLPLGTVLDGELVTLVDGLPDFEALLPREQAKSTHRIARLSSEIPAVYVAFDVLFDGHESVMEEPLHERRRRLERILPQRSGRLVLSEAVTGAGLALFEWASERSLEGIVAKDLRSPYEPGLRTGAWTKCKPTQEALCIVLGYLCNEEGLRSLVIGMEDDGVLTPVGRVASGLTHDQREHLLGDLRSRPRSEPVVKIPRLVGPQPHWVEPGPMLVVRYSERTRGGNLRSPVVVRLFD